MTRRKRASHSGPMSGPKVTNSMKFSTLPNPMRMVVIQRKKARRKKNPRKRVAKRKKARKLQY